MPQQASRITILMQRPLPEIPSTVPEESPPQEEPIGLPATEPEEAPFAPPEEMPVQPPAELPLQVPPEFQATLTAGLSAQCSKQRLRLLPLREVSRLA